MTIVVTFFKVIVAAIVLWGVMLQLQRQEEQARLEFYEISGLMENSCEGILILSEVDSSDNADYDPKSNAGIVAAEGLPKYRITVCNKSAASILAKNNQQGSADSSAPRVTPEILATPILTPLKLSINEMS